MSTRLISRIGAALGFGSLLAGLLVPAAAAAASSPTPFDVWLGSNCVGTYAAPANEMFTLVWKDVHGTLVAHQSVTTDAYGDWQFCSTGHVVNTGDTFKATAGTTTNTFVVPVLALSVNRVHDRLTGLAPAGTLVHIHCDITNGFEPCIWHQRARADINGKWSQSVPFPVIGGYHFDIKWKSDDGDSASVYGQAPYVTPELGTAKVSGAYDDGKSANLFLYDASMTLKGTASITGDAYDGSFGAKFIDAGGHTVNVAAGDTIDATALASNAEFVIPQIQATAVASTDRVSGSCENTPSSLGFANVSLYRTGTLVGWANGEGDGNGGVFDFSFRHLGPFDNEANVKVGDRLVIDCVQQDLDGALLTIHAQ